MDLTWYIQRARRMSIREVRMKASQRFQSPRIARKLRGSADVASLRQDVVLPFESVAIEDLHHPDMLRVADRVKRGDRWVLGLGWIPRGTWDWCRDPGSDVLWPAIASHRLDYRRIGTEIRLTWELNRFHDLTVMAQAFWLTHDVSYVDEIRRVFHGWCATNPVGVGPNWVSAMEAAIRIVNMTWVARMIRQSDPDLVQRLGHQIVLHEAYIAHHLSFGSSANNHLLLELMGLATAHGFWSFTAGGDKTQDYVGRFTEELNRQTGPGGMNREMSSHYHLFVAEAAVHVETVQRARNLSSRRLSELIMRMRRVIEALTVQEGICRFGDDDEGCIIRFPDGTARWDHVLAGRQTGPWTGLAPVEGDFHVPPLQSFDGIVVIRCGPFHLVVDGGHAGMAPLYAHAHDDGGSIYLAYHGSWFLVDPGTGAYFRDLNLRRALMESHAHNRPVSWPGESRLNGPFSWGQVPQRFKVVDMSVDGGASTIRVDMESDDGRYRRNVVATNDSVRVRDIALNMSFRVAITIPCGWTWSRPDKQDYLFEQKDLRLLVRWTCLGSLPEDIRSPRFGGEGTTSVQFRSDEVAQVGWEVRAW